MTDWFVRNTRDGGVETETAVMAEAYAGFAKPSETPFRDEFLPD